MGPTELQKSMSIIEGLVMSDLVCCVRFFLGYHVLSRSFVLFLLLACCTVFIFRFVVQRDVYDFLYDFLMQNAFCSARERLIQ
jgi:hypothetical protein